MLKGGLYSPVVHCTAQHCTALYCTDYALLCPYTCHACQFIWQRWSANAVVIGSPLPRKSPGGSILKFPTGCFLPSQTQYLKGFSTTSLSFLSRNLSSLVAAYRECPSAKENRHTFFFSFSLQCHSQIGSKLTHSRECKGQFKARLLICGLMV